MLKKSEGLHTDAFIFFNSEIKQYKESFCLKLKFWELSDSPVVGFCAWTAEGVGGFDH